MNASVKPIPTWILVVSGFFALMEIMVSGLIYFSPESVLETVDLQAKGVTMLFNYGQPDNLPSDSSLPFQR